MDVGRKHFNDIVFFTITRLDLNSPRLTNHMFVRGDQPIFTHDKTRSETVHPLSTAEEHLHEGGANPLD